MRVKKPMSQIPYILAAIDNENKYGNQSMKKILY